MSAGGFLFSIVEVVPSYSLFDFTQPILILTNATQSFNDFVYSDAAL